jgi:hypothetical protein
MPHRWACTKAPGTVHGCIDCQAAGPDSASVHAAYFQVNVRELRTCNDPDQFATVRAVAEFKASFCPWICTTACSLCSLSSRHMTGNVGCHGKG